MTKLTAAAYIATNDDHTAIFGIGNTEDDARNDAVRESGFESAHPGADPKNAFPTMPATQALIDQVARDGGAYISWGCVDGVACTDAEEESA